MSGFPESKDDQSNAQDARTQSGMKKRKGRGIIRRPKLEHEELLYLVDYCSYTGVLTWKNPTNRRLKRGTRAGSLNTNTGYRQINLNGEYFQEHRIIWFWVYGYYPESGLDHINRNKSDNRVENLKETSQSCNMRNASSKCTNKSGVTGVYCYKWFNKKLKGYKANWSAFITDNFKVTRIAGISDKVEAVAHRLAMEECLSWHENTDANNYMTMYLKGELNDEISD